MKKIVSALILILLFVSCLLPCSVFANETRVYDDASLFSATEKEALEAKIASLRTEIQLDFVVVTTNDTGGKSSMAYADDFYDQNGFGYGDDKSGILYLIDMENRQAYLYTCGAAITIYNDAHINKMLDTVTAYLKSQSYFRSAEEFLSDAAYYFRAGVEKGQYYYDSETGEYNYETDTEIVYKPKALEGGEILVAVLVSLAVSVIFILIVYAKYSRRSKTCPYPFREQSVLTLTRKEDIFLYITTTSRRIETNSGGGSGGGGSSTHTSSGGTTHGGGGRGF